MAASFLHSIEGARKQNLLVEFAGLKTACPQGVFITLTPGDSSLWAGVIFVRQGPYAPAVLRFHISFPPAYPSLPPLVTFSTDIFHPLITPLTTQRYTTDIQDGGTVSATDDERLPPGGFSLRHGFPGWFGRGSKAAAGGGRTSAQYLQTSVVSPRSSISGRNSPETVTSEGSRGLQGIADIPAQVTVYELLRYIRSTFDDASLLDIVPLEAAGNPGAWHAWRAHRTKTSKGAKRISMESSPDSTPAVRPPGEWNWDGVWALRSKKGIDGSLSDNVLYGNAGESDALIQFLSVEDEQRASFKEKMLGSV